MLNIGKDLCSIPAIHYFKIIRLHCIFNNLNNISVLFQNGVFDETLRACNRRDLNAQNTNTETLTAETIAFATALDTNLPLRGSMMTGLSSLVTSAVTNFQNYVGAYI